jgi:hypothetical protein
LILESRVKGTASERARVWERLADWPQEWEHLEGCPWGQGQEWGHLAGWQLGQKQGQVQVQVQGQVQVQVVDYWEIPRRTMLPYQDEPVRTGRRLRGNHPYINHQPSLDKDQSLQSVIGCLCIGT